MKSVAQIVNDAIEGTIECWKIRAEEDCNLKWQLNSMMARIFEELSRASTEVILEPKQDVINTRNYPIGMRALSLDYLCLFGTRHKVEGDSLLELNQNLANHTCDCHKMSERIRERINQCLKGDNHG